MTRSKWHALLPLTAAGLLAACVVGGTGVAQAAVCEAVGTVHEGEFRHDGEDRSYRLYLPRKAASGKVPLVLALHGGFGTGKAMAEQTGFDDKAEQYGFAVVYPDGIWRSWNAGSCCGRAASSGVDDVGFMRQLVARLGAEACIDGDRVFATGFSNGAMLSHRLACEAPEMLTAIAAVAGGPMVEACAKPRPMPALFIVGREDERIPWQGGVFDDTYRPAISEQVKAFAQRNGCAEESARLPGYAESCKGLRQCGKAAVQWCIVDGVGHQWPGGKSYMTRLLGPNHERMDAAKAVMEFFAKQP